MNPAVQQRALRMLDDALAQMGSDPCSCSFELLVDEVVERCDPPPGQRGEVAGMLRSALGLHMATVPLRTGRIGDIHRP